MMTRTIIRLGLCTTFVGIAAGCNPFAIDDLPKAVVAINEPAGISGKFGTRFATLTNPKKEDSRLGITSVQDPEYGMFRFDPGADDVDDLFKLENDGCGSCNEDGKDLTTSLGSVVELAGGKRCFVAPRHDDDGTSIDYECPFETGGDNELGTLVSTSSADFGASIASLNPEGDGAAVFGSPGDNTVFILTKAKDAFRVEEWGSYTPQDKFSYDMVSANGEDGATWVAAATEEHVALFVVNADADAVSVRGCAKGMAYDMAMGEFIGDDDKPDLVVSTGTAIRLYSGDDLDDADCDGSEAEPVQTISCDDLDVSCEADGDVNAIGPARVALVNVDKSGAPELFVGAPLSIYASETAAGTVVGMTLGGGDAAPAEIDSLKRLGHSDAAGKDHLGAGLDRFIYFGDDGAREELVVGAPGRNAAYLFLCSGLPGDRSGKDGLSDQCL